MFPETNSIRGVSTNRWQICDFRRTWQHGDVLIVAIYPPTFWRFSLRDSKYRALGLAHLS